MEHNPYDCSYCEEQRELEQKKRELEAIRAFCDRAEKQAHATATDPMYWCEAFAVSIANELKALEAEVKE